MSSCGRVTLKSADGELFEAEKKAAQVSPVLRNLLEDLTLSDEASVVPVQQATGRALVKVLEYCNKHAEDADAAADADADAVADADADAVADADADAVAVAVAIAMGDADAGAEEVEAERVRRHEEEGNNWDREFMDGLTEMEEMFEVLRAASFLNISELQDLVSEKIAYMIKDMSIEEVRDVFGIKSDFTEEEEAQLRKENQWAFD